MEKVTTTMVKRGKAADVFHTFKMLYSLLAGANRRMISLVCCPDPLDYNVEEQGARQRWLAYERGKDPIP